MMKISTKGRYALRIMVELARAADDSRPVSLRAVAERQLMTLKYLESIIALLVRERLVISMRGKSGGYRLSRPAAQYTVYEILRAAEGELEPVQCLTSGAIPCPMESRCSTLSVWRGLSKVVRDYLEGITLADLANMPAGEFSYCDGI
ncbi:MAG: Rrf2 family transcriptional regulator [Akkermansiaceae bacterium]|nr:Rrf2 family transcriptional regulator [Akkermansiaceae bacterium]